MINHTCVRGQGLLLLLHKLYVHKAFFIPIKNTLSVAIACLANDTSQSYQTLKRLSQFLCMDH